MSQEESIETEETVTVDSDQISVEEGVQDQKRKILKKNKMTWNLLLRLNH